MKLSDEAKAFIEKLDEADYYCADVFEKARQRGMTCLIPEPNQLFIDIDSEEDFKVFELGMEIFLDRLNYVAKEVPVFINPSSSGLPHRHIVVDLPFEIDDAKRLLLQTVLGSDRKRELVGFLELYNGIEHPVTFFEPK